MKFSKRFTVLIIMVFSFGSGCTKERPEMPSATALSDTASISAALISYRQDFCEKRIQTAQYKIRIQGMGIPMLVLEESGHLIGKGIKGARCHSEFDSGKWNIKNITTNALPVIIVFYKLLWTGEVSGSDMAAVGDCSGDTAKGFKECLIETEDRFSEIHLKNCSEDQTIVYADHLRPGKERKAIPCALTHIPTEITGDCTVFIGN